MMMRVSELYLIPLSKVHVENEVARILDWAIGQDILSNAVMANDFLQTRY